MLLGMTVGEGEAGRSVVIRRRQIVPLIRLRAVQEIAVIDAVRVFVQKHKNIFRPGNGREGEELHVIGIVHVETRLGEHTRVADHCVHRITAHALAPTDTFLQAADDMVRGTAIRGGGAAEAAAVQTEFDVVMTSFGDKKLDVVKIVKNITGASLMDAKKLVEGVPAKIKEKVSKEDAEKVKAELTAVGATGEVK